MRRRSISKRSSKPLLLLALLEGILWSLCLFYSCSAASAYYLRETSNLASTTSGEHAPLSSLPAFDARAFLLALRDEERARARAIETSVSYAALRVEVIAPALLQRSLVTLIQSPPDRGAEDRD